MDKERGHLHHRRAAGNRRGADPVTSLSDARPGPRAPGGLAAEQKAQTLTLVNNFSQVAVMRSPVDAPSAITLESVAKALLRDKAAAYVKQA